MFVRTLALLAALSLPVSEAGAEVSLGDAAGRYAIRTSGSAKAWRRAGNSPACALRSPAITTTSAPTRMTSPR